MPGAEVKLDNNVTKVCIWWIHFTGQGDLKERKLEDCLMLITARWVKGRKRLRD